MIEFPVSLKGNLINNQFIPFGSGKNFKKICPANDEQVLWEFQENLSHSEDALNLSALAFKQWRQTSLSERINLLKKYGELVQAKAEQIAYAIAWETGKPLWEAKTEAGALASKVQITITESLQRIEKQNFPNIMPDTEGVVQFKPLGVTVVIGPFNFPCHLANGQILSALLTGNTVIFKPSEKTVLSAQIMSECFLQAGFPQAVYQVVNGGAETAKILTSAPVTKGVYFTGSRAVGKILARQNAERLDQLLALELGGKNASILFKDASIENSLGELLKACFLTSGQRCTSTGNLIVHESLYQEFCDRFLAISQRIIVDHPIEFKTEPFMGPLIDAQAKKVYFDYLQRLQAEGGELLLPSKEYDLAFNGQYCSPTISTVQCFKPDIGFIKEEIFAPHVTIIPFREPEEAIEIANCSPYGLSAAAYTQDQSLINKCLLEIDAGIININRSTVGASSKLPFGGVKDSGNHRPAAVSMVDHCVSPCSTLIFSNNSAEQGSIKGLA
jgi:succinylglutamic semialdehyde dehydrogenase